MISFRYPLFKKPILNRFFKQCLATGILLFVGCTSHAEESVAISPSAPPLQWSEAITRTLSKNPSLIAFGFQLSAQEARVQQAGIKTNPEISLSVEDAFGTGNFSGMDQAETSLGISWVLNGRQRQQRIATAQARTSVLEVEQDIHRLDAAATTARLYINVLALQARLQQTQQSIDLSSDAVKVINSRVNAGNSPAAEVARAKVDLSRRLLEHEDIEHELDIARHQLAAHWGDTDTVFSEVRGDIFNLPAPSNYSDLRARFQDNPRLAHFVTTERLEESHIALAKAESKPQWKVSAGLKHIAATHDQALTAGVSVPLALFDQQQGRIAEARANMELSRAEREAERVRLDAAVFGLHQELLHNLHLIKAYRKDILPQLEVAMKETRRAYDLGRYGYVEWQTVQRELLDAKNSLIDASVAAHIQAIEIERLTGVAVTPHAQIN
ncbi:MAG: TolC family protein [Gammaproteobacteria bacterium]|nr:MAG: TolC family protein [Gammaproteobacteria bacterium]